ncbi:MAG: leucine-rich repeat protein, partial [Clostridia bacterium]|nr:leucine-rich repeat protein [Clostridia bacterium]
MEDYIGLSPAAPWQSYNNQIKSVIINSGVTSVGNYAFYNCSNITTVVISDPVTGIGQNAFSGCSGIKSIAIPKTVESVGRYAFSSCGSLTDVYYAGTEEQWNEISVEAGNGQLSGANVFFSAFLSDFLTYEIINGEITVTGCDEPEVSELVIPGTVGGCPVVKIAPSAFSPCEALTCVTLPGSIREIEENAFSGCDALTDVYYDGTSEQWSAVAVSDSNIGNAAIHYMKDPHTVRFIVDGLTISAESLCFGDEITVPSSPEKTGCSFLGWSLDGRTAVSVSPTMPDYDIDYLALWELNQYTLIFRYGDVSNNVAYRVITQDFGSAVTPPEDPEYNGYIFVGWDAQIPATMPAEDLTFKAKWKKNAAAYSPLTYNIINNQEVTVTGCDETASGKLVIPGTIEGYPVTSIGDSAFENCTGLTDITIPESVKTIGNRAFYGCTGLENVDFNNDYPTFDGTFRQSWQENKNPDSLAAAAFQNKAAEMNGIYDDSTSSYKFSAENRLISVNVYTDTTNCIYMDVVYNYTFVYNYNEYVDNAATGNVLTDTFLYTWSDSVKFNQTNSTKYSPTEGHEEPTVYFTFYPFYDSRRYSAYERWSHYDIDPERTDMTDSYYNLSDLTDINYNSSYGSYKGKDLIVINNLGNVPTKFFIIKQRPVDSEGVPVSDTDLAVNEAASYRACISERISDDSLLTDKDANTVYTNAGISLRNNTVFGTFTCYKVVGYTGVTVTAYRNANNEEDFIRPVYYTEKTISDYAFYGCENLTNIEIPQFVGSIGEGAFRNCDGLTDITIPNSVSDIGDSAFDSANITTVFYDGSEEQWDQIEIGSNNDSLLNADFVFNYGSIKIFTYVINDGEVTITDCDKSADGDLVIPETIKGCPVTKIGSSAFSGCKALTGVTIPAGVTSISGNAFAGCKGLERISVAQDNSVYHSSGNCLIETAGKTLIAGCKNSVIPDDGSVTSIGADAFRDCVAPGTLIIPEGVTSIGIRSFRNCSGLKNIVIPDSVTNLPGGDTLLLGSPFLNCKSLENVTIGSGVTEIRMNTFCGCGNLKTLTLSNTVRSISSLAFDDCDSLTDVYYDGTVSEWKRVNVSDQNVKNATVHYLKEPRTVSFVVDGLTVSTRSYCFGDEIIVPGNPEKSGCSFIGWSEDGVNVASVAETMS